MTVAAAAVQPWRHEKFSEYFSIYPLTSDEMGHNILYKASHQFKLDMWTEQKFFVYSESNDFGVK